MLTTRLYDLIYKRDWIRKQANAEWEQAKKFEAQGWMDMALEFKIRYKQEAHRVKCYNQEIYEIEKMIDNSH